MARLYSDEDFPFPVVLDLRRRGHDVLTVFEAGQANQGITDVDVFAFARTAGRAVLTLNRNHFIRLHRVWPDHSGIIVCRVDVDFGRLARRIQAAIEREEPLAGKLVRVNRSDA